MKRYLDVTLVTKSGIVAKNPLKLSEVNDMLLPLIENNRAVSVKIREVEVNEYEEIFRAV